MNALLNTFFPSPWGTPSMFYPWVPFAIAAISIFAERLSALCWSRHFSVICDREWGCPVSVAEFLNGTRPTELKCPLSD
jgi:hypothetical protein